MLKFLKRLMQCQYMLKPDQIVGEIPTSKFVYGKIFNMAWPSAVESVLVGLVGFVDTIMVGVLGAGAIAAVGITGQPKMILLAVIFSLNTGVTAIVARRKGEGDKEGANKCLRQALIISILFSIITCTAGIIFARPLLIFAGAGTDIIDDSVIYFVIIVIGLLFSAISMTINAAQRGVGNTKVSMVTNIVANLVNVVFNYLLITGKFGFPALGVAGAAIATLLGGIVGCVLSMMSVLGKKKGFLDLSSRAGWRFDKKTIVGITNIGSSALFEQLCLRIGFFAYVKIIATLGTTAFATHQICMQMMNLSFSFGDGLGIAAAALVGQSLGAKRGDMAIIYGKANQRIALCISTVLMILFILFRHQLMMLFTTDALIIAEGANIMVILGISSIPQTSQVIFAGSLRGAGDTKFVAGVSLVSIAISRPFFTWFFCYPLNLGLIGAWFSLLLDQVVRLVLNGIRFSGGKWTKIDL